MNNILIPLEKNLCYDPRWKCKICGQKLWFACNFHTKWQIWAINSTGKRHFKNRCNFKTKKYFLEIDNGN